jgi:DNA invertase Pin-like site-specific DNA recombinase
MSAALRVAIYCRVSSDQQERKGTIEAQRVQLLAFAERAGYTVQGVYCDDGKSAGTGKLDQRDAFARMLIAIERKEIDAVLVVAIDRLTRTDDLIERAAILGPLQRAGVAVVTPSGTIDLRTFTGDLMSGLEAAMAALERRKILERTQAGKERVYARGGKPHGRTPYGLRYDRGAGWSIDPAEADVVREIVRRVGGSESCVRIAIDLADRNIPPPGKQWGHTSVWSLVRQARERYAGQWVANARRGLTVPVPRLLSDAEIDRAEAAMIDHRRRGLEHRTRGVFLLDRHAATCGRCGAWIGVRNHGAPGDEVYTCRRRATTPADHPNRCELPGRRVKRLDGLIWAELADLLTSPRLIERVLRIDRDRGTPRDPSAARQRLADARQRLSDLDGKAVALAGRVDALPGALLTTALDRLAQERAEATAELRAAEDALARVHVSDAATADLDGWIETLTSRAASCLPDERRAIARSLLDGVTLTDRATVIQVALPVPVAASSWSGLSRIRAGVLMIAA